MRNVIPLPRCTAFFFPVLFSLILFSGCGPTRKEYAINEALLIDQTRMLEDQLYRSHFEIQHLLDENARLKEKLGETDDSESADSPVPFQNTETPKTKPDRQRPYYPPIDPNALPQGVEPPPEQIEEIPVSGYPYPLRNPQRVAQRNSSVPAQNFSSKQNYRVGISR